tara:strand:+ start:238 stop:486 length:249 start_codon:yes stop_codon:yes gene_type:complete
MNSSVGIKYKVGDIIIVNINGLIQKRHIYGNTPQEKKWVVNNTEIHDWVYSVDYGLGCTSEGFVLQSNIICLADERHVNMVL